MPSYSAQFKEQAVRRLMPPNSQTISMVSQDLGIAVPTLYAWKRQFELKGFVVPAKSSSPDKWNMKSKLAEAGYPDGFKLKMHGPAGRYTNDTQIIEAIAQMFTRLGVQTEIETMPPSNFFSRASRGANGQPEFSMILAGWGAGTGETSGSLRSLLATYDKSKGFGAANRGRYSNKDMDAKLVQALSAVDDKKRAALLSEASEIAFVDVGIIPVHFQRNVWASKKGLNVEARADEYTLPLGITKK